MWYDKLGLKQMEETFQSNTLDWSSLVINLFISENLLEK